jgi:hypothetical protein
MGFEFEPQDEAINITQNSPQSAMQQLGGPPYQSESAVCPNRARMATLTSRQTILPLRLLGCERIAISGASQRQSSQSLAQGFRGNELTLLLLLKLPGQFSLSGIALTLNPIPQAAGTHLQATELTQ